MDYPIPAKTMLGVCWKRVNGTQGQRRVGSGRTGCEVTLSWPWRFGEFGRANGGRSFAWGMCVGGSAIEFWACNGYDVSAFVGDDTRGERWIRCARKT